MRRLTPILLASASPRRLAMLEGAGFRVRSLPTEIDETPRPDEPPDELVVRLARAKAAVGARSAREDEVVVAGDTDVVLDGKVLGKPADAADAARMLRALSGREHEVIGGWCVILGVRELHGIARTRVRFRSLAEEEIAASVAGGEPLDKAGAYAIQGAEGAFVASVDGSFANVVGLPLGAVIAAIELLSGGVVPGR